MHALTDIDPINRTGICTTCGPVTLKNKGVSKSGRQQWRCHRAHNRARRLNEVPYRRHKLDTCDRCGFEPEHPCQLDVHHIDGDHSNDDPDNLRTLCANCHRLIHGGAFVV